MKMRFLYLSLFALTYSVGMLSATDDLIYLRGKNEPVKGFINKESETEIYFKDLSAGSTRKLSFSVIRKIVYGDANTDYKIALDAFHVGNYKYASRKFSDARRSQKQSRGNWHKYYIPWYYYHTQYKLFLQGGKDVKIAEKIITGIEKFVGLFPKSRFTGVAQITIGDMYFKLKKFKEAKKAYSDIAKKSKNKAAVAKAKFGLVNLYKTEGDYGKAIELGKQVVKANQYSSELISALNLMMVTKKQYDQANAIAKYILSKDKLPSSIKEAAHEMRGISSVYLGKNEEALEDLLLSKLVYSSKKSSNSNLNMYLAINIQILMEKNKKEYPSWEYKSKYDSFYRSISSKQKTFVKSFKI
jgi:tetratricopeptide (TPR) repeat protein